MTAAALVCAVALIGCGGASSEEPDLGPPAIARIQPVPDQVNPRLLRRFRPLRADVSRDGVLSAQVELGKALFFEPRLSRDGVTSCNSCHPLDRAGADQRTRSIGTGGARTARNAPTVWNAAFQAAYGWDGRATTLQQQVAGPLLGTHEMGLRSEDEVTEILHGIPGYRQRFAEAFPEAHDPISFANVTGAIAAFERTLLAPGRWDRYLGGEREALSRIELEGMKLFANLGCVSCHTGELVGGSMFAHVGVKSPWPNQDDQGRFAVTGLDADRMAFKVPTLRNVARTAPYFHDGSVAELPRAVALMSRHQLGVEISAGEVAAIVAWLGTLSGESGMEVAAPELP